MFPFENDFDFAKNACFADWGVSDLDRGYSSKIFIRRYRENQTAPDGIVVKPGNVAVAYDVVKTINRDGVDISEVTTGGVMHASLEKQTISNFINKNTINGSSRKVISAAESSRLSKKRLLERHKEAVASHIDSKIAPSVLK